MFIKSLHLENIRSYKNQDFFFREGMTLLSGDIGSGKSTVLLGIEFALFGLIRGSINGSTLLRHGCAEGSVRMVFELSGDEFEVKRGLKKGSSGISQDKCYFSKNGFKEVLSPVELKSKILYLLGYCEDLVSKSKNLIFRYTVYTPQEEMKQIIFDSKDDRLEKLRRIFGVDKYELIKVNSSNYARDLRADIKARSFLKEEQDSLNEKITSLRTEINLLYEEIDEFKKEKEALFLKEKHLGEKEESFSSKVKNFNELNTHSKVLFTRNQSLNQKIDEITSELESLNKKIKLKEKELEKIPEIKKSSLEIKKELQEFEEKRDELEIKVGEAQYKEAIISSKIKEINDLLKKVHDLDNCPTCFQEVSDAHKVKLSEQEKIKLSKYEERLKILKDFFNKVDEKKKKVLEQKKLLEQEFDKTKDLEMRKKLLIQTKSYIDENKQKINLLNIEKEKTLNILKSNKQELIKIERELEAYKDLEQKIKELKKDKEELNLLIIAQEKKISSSLQAIKIKENSLKEKLEDHEKKKKTLKQLEEKKVLENWLSNHFVNLMSVIEKHVLVSIHKEFNYLFREWFSMLIEDAELEANIEQDFSPSIIQNGYDASIENLSGGEKTAVSLAYRLALNKVINDLVHDVKTKQVLILDEPTDGFSSDQLDKVRDVLEKTNTKQILIVSHEAKLESFVQNIIRVTKNNHESEAVQL